jgi:crotonobetainyl-CoA:carnitine CoA-transferase CaiB-like acyl-CoA transferase
VSARVEARHVLHARLEETFRTTSTAEWVERMQVAGVPAGPVNDLRQAIEHPIVAERELLMPPEGTPRIPDLRLLRLPIDTSRTARRRTPPRLGEHTVEVLREMGFDAEEISALVSGPTTDRIPAPLER